MLEKDLTHRKEFKLSIPVIQKTQGVILLIENVNRTEILIIVGGYLFLLGTSGKVLNYILYWISGEPIGRKINKEAIDTGFVIGKCENLLILTFMLLDAYIALALVFSAKAIRSSEMSKSPLFFFVGTMINVTYSIMIGFVIKIILWTI